MVYLDKTRDKTTMKSTNVINQHSPSVSEDDVAVPDLVSGRDGDLLAGERDAVHEVVDVAAQLIPRLVVAHAGEPDRVDPGFNSDEN